ncbi:serine/threonine-protein kinase [Herpetosiphon giganteus]|uniref:serine/threonine-protein kinase n=1 Tax=Herpetosiphon giganteus TaxID=2029754 RepID=UPI0019573FE7|nr:serine/threonine-protein kinase [Herpetosiphon giganteus]MBM7843782.1 serine/threonine protein kinase [Herpetosiphon giganteus]
MAPTIYGERWEIIKSLGEGGQGLVFRVKDLKGGGDIEYVLKRLKNNNRIERFRQEVEAVRLLQHTNIVSLVDFDLEAPKAYMVFEYCTGGDLTQARSIWEGDAVKALKVFYEICEGIAYAHKHNIFHRDIKPQNIFFRTPNGPPVIGDFGICYIDDNGARLTITEEAVGPRSYMAPELEDGRANTISGKSDVYSLGKLLYWMLSNKIFSREKHREVQWDLKGINNDKLLGWNNIYMEHVNNLLDLMIQDEPDKRYSINSIIVLLKQTIRLIEKEFTPISKNIKHPCTYCGSGYYIVKTTDKNSSSNFALNFGFKIVGDPAWKILVCNNCAHIQLFRLDFLPPDNEWEK